MQTKPQQPGHMFGPPMTFVSFSCGEQMLGTVPGHPLQLEDAKQRAIAHLRILDPIRARTFGALIESGVAQARWYLGPNLIS